MAQNQNVFAAKMDRNALEAIGQTRLVMIEKITKGLGGSVAVKMEYLNPTCSVKDRPARKMIEDAEKRGELFPGVSVLIEGTSGNMGIAIASIARIKGYKCILVMPASMSIERRAALRAYGAQLVLTDPALGFAGVMERLNAIAEVIPNCYKTGQFENPSNPQAHYETTGPEIWEQSDHKVDIVVFGVGTGGTVSGVGKFLKEKNSKIKAVAVEPYESSVISGMNKGTHKIQGIGAGFIPNTLDMSVVDEVLRVHSDDAIKMAQRLALEEGIMGGISSGANLCAAVELASRPENKGKLIVTTVNSYGERYLSSPLYDTIRFEAGKMEFTTLEDSVAVCKAYLV